MAEGSPDNLQHHFPIRVYYEDTDMGGIVYYANYLRYIERARSDWVREIGIDQNDMRENGQVFAVRRVEADYLVAAKFDDQLDVVTQVNQVSGARLVLDQCIFRKDQLVFQALVTLVCLGKDQRATRFPANIRRLSR